MGPKGWKLRLHDPWQKTRLQVFQVAANAYYRPPGRAHQSGYFLGLPRLCGFTGTSFVLGVPSSGLERLWPGTLTDFAPGLAIISSECLNASTVPASQQSGCNRGSDRIPPRGGRLKACF